MPYLGTFEVVFHEQVLYQVLYTFTFYLHYTTNRTMLRMYAQRLLNCLLPRQKTQCNDHIPGPARHPAADHRIQTANLRRYCPTVPSGCSAISVPAEPKSTQPVLTASFNQSHMHHLNNCQKISSKAMHLPTLCAKMWRSPYAQATLWCDGAQNFTSSSSFQNSSLGKEETETSVKISCG